MENNYKQFHESFVSNHTGSSVLEISIVLSVTHASIFLNYAIILLLGSSYQHNFWLCFLVEFPCSVLPTLLALTAWSEHIHSIYLTILIIGFSSILLFVYNIPMKAIKTDLKTQLQTFLECPIDERLPFISNFKAFTLIGTVVAILAVDFAVFPRRFCKTETYGTGMMDAGVGLFIMSNAIVSPEARSKQYPGHQRIHKLYKSVLSSIPLLILGIARVVATKGVDYHEHVTEYGTHWNFFFTLTAVKIFASILSYIVPVQFWKLVAVLLSVLYQYTLTYIGGSQYIIQGLDGRGGRDGVLESNREGVISSLGYFILYIFGVVVGKVIFGKGRKTIYDYLALLGILTVATVTLFTALPLITQIEPVSRRFANVPYIIWMLGLSLQMIGIFLFLDLCFLFLKKIKEKMGNKEQKEIYSMIEAVNYNGLLYFLVANLLTGLVNLTIRTILIPPLYSVLILTLYMLVLSLTTYVLYAFNVKVKFW